MPTTDPSPPTGAPPPSPPRPWSSIFALPAPLRDLFNLFPLTTYPANPLPSRSLHPSSPGQPQLYIFSTPSDAAAGLASLNPTCLKHQAHLLLTGIPFTPVASNNHASPSGALPFLLPASTAATPIPAPRLRRWAEAAAPAAAPPPDAALDVHAALLETRLRRAWLYQLYLDPANAPAAEALYVAPASSAGPVRLVLAYQLRRAAEDELKKSGRGAGVEEEEEEEELLEQGREALGALERVLAERGGEWFSGSKEPGWFDAMVYAYTGPLLDARMGWVRNGLGDTLRDLSVLMGHRHRIAARCGWA